MNSETDSRMKLLDLATRLTELTLTTNNAQTQALIASVTKSTESHRPTVLEVFDAIHEHLDSRLFGNQ